METICRLCLHKYAVGTMKDLFESFITTSEIPLVDFLYWTFGIEIFVEDTFTKLICGKCSNVLQYVGTLRKFFQTNQKILQERRCPDDYEVELGWNNTREKGTNTDLSYIKNTQLCSGQARTAACKRKQTDADNCVEKVDSDRCNVPMEIFGPTPLKIPKLQLRKIDECCSDYEYQKVEDLLYRKNPATEENCHEVESSSDEEDVANEMAEHVGLSLEAYVDIPRLSDSVIASCELLEETISLSDEEPADDEPESSPRPVVTLNKLEDCCVREGYNKVDEFLYKPASRDPVTPVKTPAEKRKCPTSIVNGAMRNESAGFPRINSDVLFTVNDSCNVVVCEHCSRTFRNGHLLRLHRDKKHEPRDLRKKRGRPKKRKLVRKKPGKILPYDKANTGSPKRKRGRPRKFHKESIDDLLKSLTDLKEDRSEHVHFKKRWNADCKTSALMENRFNVLEMMSEANSWTAIEEPDPKMACDGPKSWTKIKYSKKVVRFIKNKIDEIKRTRDRIKLFAHFRSVLDRVIGDAGKLESVFDSITRHLRSVDNNVEF